MGDVVAIERTKQIRACHDAVVEQLERTVGWALIGALTQEFTAEEIWILEREGCLTPEEAKAAAASPLVRKP